jgi:hypothetical protein
MRLIKPLEPGKAAQRIIEGMERNRYRILVGGDSKLMDLFYRVSPKQAATLIFNLMVIAQAGDAV